jgi:sRNA-binding regulator protein Hfq
MDGHNQPPGGNPPNEGSQRVGADRSQRRTPPPDATGDEAAYLARLREKRTPIALELLDGSVFRGIIEYYDRDMIKVNRHDGGGPNAFVRKKHVRMLWEEAAPPTT